MKGMQLQRGRRQLLAIVSSSYLGPFHHLSLPPHALLCTLPHLSGSAAPPRSL